MSPTSRASKLLLIAGTLAALSPARALACAVCYGESDAPMARGAAFAILTLGVVIGAVLLGVAAFFFLHLRRKGAEAALSARAESAQCNV